MQQEAEARLPAEPPESSASSCRIAIRLPDGQRLQRRFDKLADTVQVRRPKGGGVRKGGGGGGGGEIERVDTVRGQKEGVRKGVNDDVEAHSGHQGHDQLM